MLSINFPRFRASVSITLIMLLRNVYLYFLSIHNDVRGERNQLIGLLVFNIKAHLLVNVLKQMQIIR